MDVPEVRTCAYCHEAIVLHDGVWSSRGDDDAHRYVGTCTGNADTHAGHEPVPAVTYEYRYRYDIGHSESFFDIDTLNAWYHEGTLQRREFAAPHAKWEDAEEA